MAQRIPTIGITMGDPAGIGPEVVLKALSDAEVTSKVRPVVIADAEAIRRTSEAISWGSGLPFEIVDLKSPAADFEFGEVSAATGMAAGQCIEKAVELWKLGEIDAVCTPPINKRSLALGGYDFPGHTEFLAALTDTKDFAMSFFAEKLRVVLLSTHVALRDAIELVTPESLARLVEFADRTLSGLIGKRPKIAVAGINPHASEGGMFGYEEAERIEPAIESCRARGIDVSGPYSPDTIFLRGFRGEFDLVVACYHDQATIAVKAFSFGASVNVTLGLPLIRTSVDHGTAFDIAGKGLADASSMKAAIKLAGELVHARGFGR